MGYTTLENATKLLVVGEIDADAGYILNSSVIGT